MTTATSRATTDAAPTWLEYAACAGVDADLFFPVGNGDSVGEQTADAKRVCAGCPVKSECLDWALETRQYTGVWGGLSERERRGMYPPATSHVDLCMGQQEYIEQRVAQGASHREIGAELGVVHSAVGRAWRFFQSERSDLVAAGGEGA